MRTLLGIAGVAVLVGTAVPAYADPSAGASGPDAKFLAYLKQEGVTYKDGPVAIAVGRKSCELMDQGHARSQIIQSLAADNPGFSSDSATKFTMSAVEAYCPEHADSATASEPASPAPAPPAPAPPAQQPIINFPIITPGAS